MADTKKNGGSAAKNTGNKQKGMQKSGAARSGGNEKSFSYQLLPYIFAIVALFFALCFITNLFCNPDNELAGGSEGEHILGHVGFWVCNIMFGIFGPAAFTVPVLLIVFVVFWKNYNQRSYVTINGVIAAITAIVISAFIHIVTHMADGKENFNYDVAGLFEEGAALDGGGVLGGILSFALVNVFNIVGAIFVVIVLLIPMITFLAGTTPLAIASRIFAKIKASVEEKKLEDAEEKRAQKQALKEEREAERLAKKEAKEQERLAREEEKAREEEERAAQEEKDAEAERNSAAADERSEDGVEASKDGNGEPDNDVAENEDDADDEDELSLNAFEDGDKDHGDSLKRSSFTEYDDEERAEEIFPKDTDDGELDGETENEGGTTVFVDPNATKRKDGSRVIDDMASELFDENGNITVDTETGEVIEKVAEEIPTVREYQFPPADLLEAGSSKYSSDPAEIEQNKELLRGVLQDFKISIKDISCSCGPTITRYEVKPEAGVRVRQIANLVDDISLSLAKSGVRIEAPIPGKAAVGIEVPNDKPSPVKLRSLIENPEFTNHKSKIAACLGADVSGNPVVFDIEKMPHLLVAGTTGSGKSVCINSIIMSILYRARPEEVKLLLIDPKKVEFKIYKDIPHLCCRIVSDPKKAAGALNSAVNEMEKRFELIEEVGVRNITGYNEITKNDPEKPYMPRLVIIIDEFADLMMTAKDEVETAVCRIAQKARAAGIHLIIGTQRPSVDVITGLIKANIPSRIAFTVMSQVDSRTILDTVGAEKLCGRGDMLYAPVGASKPQRVQGTFVSDDEVERVVDFVRDNNPPVIYDQEFESSIDIEAAKCGNPGKASGAGESFSGSSSGEEDPKLYDALDLAIDAGKISTSLLQRRLEVGYGRAAKIIDRMEELGYVGPADGNKPRKILITREELDEKMAEQE